MDNYLLYIEEILKIIEIKLTFTRSKKYITFHNYYHLQFHFLIKQLLIFEAPCRLDRVYLIKSFFFFYHQWD